MKNGLIQSSILVYAKIHLLPGWILDSKAYSVSRKVSLGSPYLWLVLLCSSKGCGNQQEGGLRFCSSDPPMSLVVVDDFTQKPKMGQFTLSYLVKSLVSRTRLLARLILG